MIKTADNQMMVVPKEAPYVVALVIWKIQMGGLTNDPTKVKFDKVFANYPNGTPKPDLIEAQFTSSNLIQNGEFNSFPLIPKMNNQNIVDVSPDLVIDIFKVEGEKRTFLHHVEIQSLQTVLTD